MEGDKPSLKHVLLELRLWFLGLLLKGKPFRHPACKDTLLLSLGRRIRCLLRKCVDVDSLEDLCWLLALATERLIDCAQKVVVFHEDFAFHSDENRMSVNHVHAALLCKPMDAMACKLTLIRHSAQSLRDLANALNLLMPLDQLRRGSLWLHKL